MTKAPRPDAPIAPQGTAREVFAVFLKLGLTSFGGPIAHLGYFRDELVTRRGWLSDATYADLVALCQFLPGPASSQTGFALGMMRAGWAGALAAFAAFTLPSAVILFLFAILAPNLSGPVGLGALAGLKIVAVAIVAQAVLGMARSLCPDRNRAAIAAIAIAILAIAPGAVGMIAAILTGAVLGLATSAAHAAPAETAPALPVSRRQATAALALFTAFLLGLPLLAPLAQGLAVVDGFYRAGALVFGGGHVVLPLLETGIVAPGWVTSADFIAGYGAAQAVPGPLFTFAAYLGATLGPAPNGIAGATLALGAIFLPGFLLLVGVLPFWDRFRRVTAAQSAMRGANAAVVGVLATALHTPVFTSAVTGRGDFALAVAGFVALTAWKAPPWVVVLASALGGIGLALIA